MKIFLVMNNLDQIQIFQFLLFWNLEFLRFLEHLDFRFEEKLPLVEIRNDKIKIQNLHLEKELYNCSSLQIPKSQYRFA